MGVVEEVEEVLHLPWGVMVNVEMEVLWEGEEVLLQVVNHFVMVLEFQRKNLLPQLTQLEMVRHA